MVPEGRGDGEVSDLTEETADRIGQMLIDENVESVGCRYEGSDLVNLPGPNTAEWLIPFKFVYTMERLPAIETLKIIACYEYQSCEHDGWKDSEAKCFCNALIKNAIQRLPGYEEAPWEWTQEPNDAGIKLVG